MKLVIAEKPMLARDIARAICKKPISETEKLPISGNGYTVTACAGHLLKFSAPDDVDERWGQPWREDALHHASCIVIARFSTRLRISLSTTGSLRFTDF